MGTEVHPGLGAAVLLMASLCGCGSSGDGARATPSGAERTEGQSVCGECPAHAGGESSDFGGTPHTCGIFEVRTLIDRDRATELDFDLNRLDERIQRPIDAPLRWEPAEPTGGGPAAGYEPKTWIQGTARLPGWITHVGLDAARCEGTACVDPEYGEWTCSERLELGIEAEVRTLDGAVSASLTGYVLYGRAGEQWHEPPGSSLRANLRDVHGTLRLAPDETRPIIEGRLAMDLFFKADHTEGDLRAFLLLGDSDTAVSYLPISGHWPDAPHEAEEAPMGGETD